MENTGRIELWPDLHLHEEMVQNSGRGRRDVPDRGQECRVPHTLCWIGETKDYQS